ncbi:unnamed protein product [Lupinus luteus]|uniref:O-methyltransferase dimerisation domain-containing protein n=1 Tax=Lupinus luteus TaxID=3873 RepID=A0AAV1WSZ4_LUPLU
MEEDKWDLTLIWFERFVSTLEGMIGEEWCIKWAIELGILDIVHNRAQPITLPHLVLALQVPQAKVACVQRLMRLLAYNHFFVKLK